MTSRNDITEGDFTYYQSRSKRNGNFKIGDIYYGGKSIGVASMDNGWHHWRFIPNKKGWKEVEMGAGETIRDLMRAIQKQAPENL